MRGLTCRRVTPLVRRRRRPTAFAITVIACSPHFQVASASEPARPVPACRSHQPPCAPPNWSGMAAGFPDAWLQPGFSHVFRTCQAWYWSLVEPVYLSPKQSTVWSSRRTCDRSTAEPCAYPIRIEARESHPSSGTSPGLASARPDRHGRRRLLQRSVMLSSPATEDKLTIPR